MSFNNFTSASLAGAAILLGASPVIAGVTSPDCYNSSVTLQTTNWTDSVSVPKFDPNLGILISVEFELRGDITGSASMESLDAAPSVVTTDYQAAITLTRPDSTVLVVATPNANFVDSLTAFDGTIDFGGTSGIAHLNISTFATEVTLTYDPADLALFTGAGNIVLPVLAAGSSVASGSGNLITQFLTDAGAAIRVCYNFEPDCNGNGIPDSRDVTGFTPFSNDANMNGVPDECEPNIRSFCEGDGAGVGGGIDCPCNNNGAPGEGCLNGAGVGGLLTAAGTPSISNDTVVLTASQLPLGTHGFFFFSRSQPAQSQNGGGVVFGNGIRCLATPTYVEKVVNGGIAPPAGAPPLSVQLGITAGETTYWQFWYRDRGGPCVAGQVSATNGIEIVWGL